MGGPNPDWELPNKNISPSQITQRTFDNPNDAVRVNLVAGDLTLDVGDVQLGAVEIKDHDSGLRLDVGACGDYNAALVTDCVEYQKVKHNIFGSAMVSPGATVTLATFTVPSGKLFRLTGGSVGGRGAGEFKFDVGGATVDLIRNSGSDRTVQATFTEPPDASATTVVKITVKNIYHVTRMFEARLSGYTITP